MVPQRISHQSAVCSRARWCSRAVGGGTAAAQLGSARLLPAGCCDGVFGLNLLRSEVVKLRPAVCQEVGVFGHKEQLEKPAG